LNIFEIKISFFFFSTIRQWQNNKFFFKVF